MSQSNSNYVQLRADKSICYACKEHLTLIQHKEFKKTAAMFYICWNCKKILEVGKGEVRNVSS